MAVAEARADREHHVGLQEQLVRVALARSGCPPCPPTADGLLGMAPLPISVGETGMSSVSASATSSSARVRHDHAAAGDDDRPLGARQQLQRALDRAVSRRRLGEVQRPVGLQRELDVRALLDVERQVEQHRAGPALAADPERLAERPRQLRGLLDLVGPLADGAGDLDDVDRLERLAVQHVGVRLAGDADHRDRVGQRRVEPGDHVRARGAGRADRDARLAGDPRPAVGGVRAALLVAHGDVADRRPAQRVVERQDRGAGHAEARP